MVTIREDSGWLLAVFTSQYKKPSNDAEALDGPSLPSTSCGTETIEYAEAGGE